MVINLRNYLWLEIVYFLPKKTRVLLPNAVRLNIINEGIVRFGGKEKLAKFFGLNRKVPTWWEKGKCRPSIMQLKALGVSNPVISKAKNFGLEGSKKDLKLPTKVCFGEMFAWFLGLRHGDSDETCSDVGVGNSSPKIIQKCIGFFKKFNIDESQLWLYVWTIDANINRAKEKWSKEVGIPLARIRVYPATLQNTDYASLRLSCLLF